MRIRINRFDAGTGEVDVTFSHDGILHRRRVNACLAGDGTLDRSATRARLADVARGVQAKIASGAIASPSSGRSGVVTLTTP